MASRIAGITVEIGGDTTKLTKALEGVNKSIRKTQSGLKDVEKLLKLDPANTELVTQKQRLLKEAIEETGTKLSTLKTAAEQANTQLANGEITQKQYDALQREIVETEEKLKSLKEAAATTNATLAKIEDVAEKFDKVGTAVSGVGEKLLPLSTAVAAAGTAAVKMTSDFDTGMSRVGAISGATEEELSRLRQTAKDLGADTAFSASEAAAGMENLASAGFAVDEIIEAMPGMLDLAASSGEDLASSADIAASTLRGFGMEASEAGHVADVLAQNAAATNAAVADTGEAMKYIAPLANSMGLQFEEVAASIGIMANSGIKGSQAGTTIRSALSRLAKPTDTMTAKMDELGISFYNSDGKMKSLAEMVGMLQSSMAGLTDEEQQNALVTLFGQNALSGMMVLMDAGEDQLNALTESYKNCDGAASDMAVTMMDNLAGDIEELSGGMETFAISIGEIIIPTIREIIRSLQGFVDKLNALNPAAKELVVKIGLIVAAAGPFLIILGKMITSVGTAMTAYTSLAKAISKVAMHVSDAGGLFKMLGTAISGISAPVLAAVTVIGTLAAAFATLWNTNEEFRSKMTAIWNEIVTTVSSFCDNIVQRLNSLGFSFSDITDVLKAVWLGFCDLLAPAFEGAFQVVSTVLSTVLNALIGVLDVFANLFQGNWRGVWEAVKSIFSAVWEGVKSILSTVLNTLKGIADAFLGWFGTNWSSVWTSVKTVFTNVWNGIATTLSNAVNGIKTTVSNAFTAIKTTVTNLANGAKTAATGAFQAMHSGISNTMGNIKTAISNGFSQAVAYIKNIVSSAKTWGSDMIANFVSGIKEKAKGVTNAVKDVAGNIRSMLHFSVPDKGPLADADEYMPDFMELLASGIRKNQKQVISAVEELAEGMHTGFSEELDQTEDRVQRAVSGMTSTVRSSATKMAAAAQKAATGMKSGLIGGMSDAKGKLTTIWGQLKDVVVEYSNAMTDEVIWATGEMVDSINTIGSSVSSLGSSLSSLGETFNLGFLEDFGGFLSKAGSTVNNLMNIGQQMYKIYETAQTLPESFQKVTTALSNIDFSGLLSKGQALLNSFGLTSDKISGIGTTVKNLVAQLGSSGGNITGILSNIGSVATGLLSKLGGSMTGIVSTVGSTLSGLAGTAGTTIAGLLGSAGTTIGGLAASAGTALTGIASSAGGLLASAGTALAGLAGPAGIAVAAVAGVGIGVKALWDNCDGFREGVTNIWNGIKNVFSNGVQAIKNGISGAVSAVSKCASAVWGGIKNTVSSAASWGKDIVSGIAGGITSGISGVTKAVKGVASKIRSFLHFSVPDTGPLADADEYMPDFMDLLTSGVKGKENSLMDQVRSLAGKVRENLSDISDIELPSLTLPELTANWNSPTPALAGASTMNTTNLGGVSITVNGYNARSDDDLARTIADKINSMINEDKAVYR